MSLRLLLLTAFFVLPVRLAGDTVHFVLYAVDAGVADRFPPELAGSGTKLAEHLATLTAGGKAAAPLAFTGELKWAAAIDLSEGDEMQYPLTFTAAGRELKRDQLGTRFIGYNVNYRVLRAEEGEARIKLLFEWTPGFAKVEIANGGDDGWVPNFHTIKTELSTAAKKGEKILAGTWRAGFPLAEKDKPAERQLYLIIHWTEGPAEP